MILSAAQIQGYAAAAGFSGADLATAVAIALAESSGDPSAINPEGSYGLWQIYLPMHPEFAGVNLLDPQANAAAAFSVYSKAHGFGPWSTFNSGAYAKYLASVPNADAPLTLPGAGSTPPLSSPFAPSTSVMTLFPTTISPNSASAPDFGTIALALALAAGVAFAFSEG
jgi:Lysozyme like domain